MSTPRTGYRAVVAGVGTRLRLGASSGAVVVAALSQGTRGPSARLYLLPSVTAGRLTASATATLYQPLGGATGREAALNPLTLTVRTGPVASPGIAVVFRAAEGQPSRTGFGPALQLRTPVGVFSAQFLPLGLPRPEVRGSYRMLF